MAAPRHNDAVVIGAGQAGVPLAYALAQSGRSTALIERQHVGGACLNEGCTLTKTIVARAGGAQLARGGAAYGVRTGPIAVDLAKVRRRKRDIVASFGGAERRLKQTDGLDLLAGEASFTALKSLDMRLDGGDRVALTAYLIVINTGTRPARPPLLGLDDMPALDSPTIMELDSVPEHLLVLGGGYIGLEFGQMFRRFGSRVIVVERDDQLLGREGPDVAEAVTTRVATMPMSYVAPALEVDESRGFMKAVVDARSRQILGFTVFGLEGGELMALVEVAKLGKLPYTVLRDAIFAHPTLAESLNNLFATVA